MSDLIHYSRCPICGSTDINKVLSAVDHTVSKQTFDIIECGACTLRFTQDVPDPASIGPYYKAEDYISHTDTSRGFINKLYKAVRKQTLARKRKLVEHYTGLKKGNFLDLGSGTGSFVNEMKQHGWSSMGLEPDPDARATATQLYGLDLGDTSIFYQLSSNSYNAITLWHVLEHVHDLKGYVQQLKNILEPNGRIFIAVPNYTALDAKIYQGYWAAYDVPRHLYHFSPKAMTRLMDNNGLRIEQYKPMWYDSFYISLLSSKYKHGSANWITSGWNGLRSNLAALTNTQRCSSVIYVIRKD